MDIFEKIVIGIICLINAAQLCLLLDINPSLKGIIKEFKRKTIQVKPLYILYIPSFFLYFFIRLYKQKKL